MKKTLLAISLTAGVSCYAHAGDFTVQLNCPDKLLRDEFMTEFKVALSNGTASAIRVYEKAGTALNAQVFFHLASQAHMDYCLRERYLSPMRTNSWGSLSTNTSSYKTRLLNPGETHEWGFCVITTPFLHENFLPGYLNTTQAGVYAQVLVGPDQWACSNTNTVSFSTQSCNDGAVLFTVPLTTPLGLSSYSVREITIDGERFLLGESARMCKISPTVTPSFAVDAVNPETINVTFDDNTPSLQWDIRNNKLIP